MIDRFFVASLSGFLATLFTACVMSVRPGASFASTLDISSGVGSAALVVAWVKYKGSSEDGNEDDEGPDNDGDDNPDAPHPKPSFGLILSLESKNANYQQLLENYLALEKEPSAPVYN